MSKSIWHVVLDQKMGISKNRWGLHRWKWSREGVPGLRTSVSKKHRNVDVSLFKIWAKYTHRHRHTSFLNMADTSTTLVG